MNDSSNAVDFLYRAKPCGEAHHAVTHVAIKHEVRTQGHEAVGLFHVADLEPWGTHFDTQGFGLIAARNGAAIVVAEHHHGAAFE